VSVHNCNREQNLERERCAQLYDRRGSVHTEFSQLQQLEQTFTANRKTNSTFLWSDVGFLTC